MADTTKTLRLAIAADTNNAEKAFANLNKELKNTGVSIASFSTAIYKNAEGVDTYAHSISLAATSVKKLEDAQKSLLGSSQQGPITSNALKDAEALAKSKADLASKSSADMVAKAKASVTAQLIAIREGENSIAAVKNASAERQKQIETNLQEKLKAIRDRYAAGEFNKGSLDLSIKSITDAYQRQTISLAVETDKRIAKIKEEQAAQEAYSRSLIGRLSSAPRYTPPTSMISGMSEAGRAASASAAAATIRPLAPIPPVSQETRSSYDSLFARIGAINLEYRIWNTLINTVSDSIRNVPKLGIELDSVKASLTATTGSTAGMAAALTGLKNEALRTGIEIGTLRENFKNFQASTSLAGASSESTWRMFTNLNTVITALHLSTDRAQGVFMAMSQIFNKSKVQSEELVKQLGNLLPGAFASFAASMGILPSELSKRMKEGTVFAQDTMENFIRYMADRFSPAFTAASDGLNANVGRMKTSFTNFSEAVYAQVSPALNEYTKKITEAVNYSTRLVEGTESLTQTLKLGLAAGAALAALELVKLIETLLKAEVAAKALQAALAIFTPGGLLKAGIMAAAGAITYLGLELHTASGSADALDEAMKRLRGTRAKLAEDSATSGKIISDAEALQVKAQDDERVRTLNKAITDAESKVKDLKAAKPSFLSPEKDLAERSVKIKAIEKEIADSKIQLEKETNRAVKDIQNQEEEEFKRRQQARGINQEEIYSQELHRLLKYAKTAEQAGKYARENELNNQKKHRAEVEKEIERYNAPRTSQTELDKLTPSARKERLANERIRPSAEEHAKNLEIIRVMNLDLAEAEAKGKEDFNKKSESAARKGAAERLRGIKEEIGVVQEYQRTAANDAKTQIDILNADNKAKILSFEDYAKRKQEILEKDYKAEKAYYEQQKALAEQSGKKGLVADANEKLKRLEQDYQAKTATSQAETSKNIEDYNTNLANIHSKYLDILGVENDSNEQTKIKNAELRKQIVAETTVAGIVGETAKARLKEFDAVENNLKVQAKFKDYQENMRVAQDKYGESVARINVLKNVGAINDFTAAQKMKAANLEAIADKEKEISLMEDRLKLEQESGSPVAKSTQEAIRKARAELENFKLEADTVGQYFENTLGTAFESSFQGLITGTMTAKEAFKSFASSVVSDIAKIIAQEARSALLKPLIGAAFSGLGSMFGGLFSSGTGAIDMQASSFDNVVYSAKGNVFAGAGISAHSGTIVNSPTVFPFAKGVGLMGEAGPEAVLPLKRNSQGKLGVSAENSGQKGGNNIYYINTTVNAGSNATPDSIANKASEAIVRAIARQEINSAARPGNRLNQITKYG